MALPIGFELAVVAPWHAIETLGVDMPVARALEHRRSRDPRATVRRALQLIDAGALDTAGVEALAARLGLCARHLRRLFVQHVGASPRARAQSRRLQFAHRLVVETDLPIVDVAFESGFRSLRRFNAAFREAYGCSPQQIRKRRGARTRPHAIRLTLEYHPPYDWRAVLDFLAARAVPELEVVRDGGYARTVVLNGEPALVRITRAAGADALVLQVEGAVPGCLMDVVSRARRCFDLSLDPGLVSAALGDDPVLGPLVARAPGLRIPGVWTGFECAVRALLGQASPEAECRLVSRLVRCAGSRAPSSRPGEPCWLFPTGQALATAPLESVGLAYPQAAAVRALAVAFVERRIDFSAPADELVPALRRLPGFGERAVQYFSLRALADRDAFPLTDVDLWRAPARTQVVQGASVDELGEAWRPWRGYAALHLWRESRESAHAVPNRPAEKRRTAS